MEPKPPKRRPKGGAADLGAAESVPRPVAALANSFVRGCVIPPHFHKRAQLIYAVQGTMTVRAAGGFWLLPPSHALWMPAGVVHEIRMGGAVEMRTLYIEQQEATRFGVQCRVLFVSPLLRELIARAVELPSLYEQSGMEGRLMSLILDEIASLPPQPLGLRMPTDPRLLRLCELMLRDLSAPQSMARLGARVGLSERSVIRLFPKQTGLSFVRWRNQARLLKAFELLEGGQSITKVALELGYASPSAFSKMFRRTLGKTPMALLPKDRGRH
jgi:AraC-like DNA-binding protein/mannose-6-phosphate isomerase-like protein (cupin superfamily)